MRSPRFPLEREAETEDRIWQLPRLIAAKNGKDYFVDAEGEWWRAMTIIASAASHDHAQGPEHALEAGAVLGQFHRLVSDLDPSRLKDTLPGFHVTPLYLRSYDETLRSPEAASRLKSSDEAERLSRSIEQRRDFAAILESARAQGTADPAHSWGS